MRRHNTYLDEQNFLEILESKYKGNVATYNSIKYHLKRYLISTQTIEKFDLLKGNVFEVGGEYFPTEVFKTFFEGYNLFHSASDLRSRQPFNDSFFDSIIAMEVFEHINDVNIGHHTNFSGLSNMLSEFHRVLKDDGHLFITTPNIISSASIKRIFKMHHPFMYGPHFREYTPLELQDILNESGFKILYMQTEYVWTSKDVSFDNEVVLKNSVSSPCSECKNNLRGDDTMIIAQKDSNVIVEKEKLSKKIEEIVFVNSYN